MTRTRTILTIDNNPRPVDPRPMRASWYAPGLSDGLGDRLLMFDNAGGASLELLRFKPEFSSAPLFEDALRARVTELENFNHASVAKVRRVEWLGDDEGLALVSNHTTGRRLSEILQEARGPTFAIELIRQLTPVLADLQRQGPGIAHGVLTPDRIVVTPEGRLVLVEHVLGSALDSLGFPAARLRSRLGIVAPPGDRVVFDSRTDVIQLAFIALSLLVGRPLDPYDYPSKSAQLLDDFANAQSGNALISPRLYGWLESALQLSTRTFDSAQDAHDALGDVSHDRPAPIETPRALYVVPTPSQPAATPDAIPAAIPAHTSEPAKKPAVSGVRLRTGAGSGVARWTIAALTTLVVAEATVIAGLLYIRPASLIVESPQPGAQVIVDGRSVGVTPLTLNVGSSTRSIRVLGAETLQPPAPVVPALTSANAPAQLEITSEPAGARVSVDGVPRGVTPLTVPADPGKHTVIISNGTATSSRVVTVAAGGTAAVMAALLPAGAAAGWVALQAPVDLQVREGGSLLGTTSAERLMLPAGHHQLELTHPALGFRTTVAVDVLAGKTVTTGVTIPNGSLSINAVPWANVWLDGQALGTTPLANLQVPIGTHEIVFRHPQLGERHQNVVVISRSPVRVGMDFSK